MSVFSMAGSNPALPTYPLQRSVRLRSSASAYFNKTLASGSTTAWTWSGWVKRGYIGTNQGALFFGDSTSTNYGGIYFGSDVLSLINRPAAGVNAQLTTTQVFRDPSAWYHIVAVWDTANATSGDRLRLYVNGVRVTAFSTATYPALSTASVINTAIAHEIGSSVAASAGLSNLFDGYLTEINFIDGQALTPASFGAYNSYGVWSPAKYTGSYGTNGFYLNFQDNSALTTTANVGIGKDSSGNGNYWKSNNISITAGTTYDSMLDVPTPTSATNANYAVLNPLAITQSGTTTVVSDGNLGITSTTAAQYGYALSTIAASTKVYWESVVTSSAAGNGTFIGASLATGTLAGANNCYYVMAGGIYLNGVSQGTFASFVAGDIIGNTYDPSTGTLTFYKNNTLILAVSTGWTGSDVFPFLGDGSSGAVVLAINFGQRPFTYTPPTGYNRLCTYNLPDSIVPVGAQYMAATLYTGAGTTQSITNTVNGKSIQPDLVWLKGRSNNGYSHYLYDSIRGVTKSVSSDTTGAEQTIAQTLTSFDSTGFTLGTIGGAINNSGSTFVGWQWRASNASAVTNTAGSITSQVSANQTAGFSIVTYTGTGANATVGHGLNVAPKMMLFKGRNVVSDWVVYHANIGNTGALVLNQTIATSTSINYWNNTSPTSSVFTIGIAGGVNNSSSNTYVAYCFAAVPGYSAFGSYTGNGSADGPFIYTGFRPRWIMIKKTDSSSDWWIWDTSRNTYNQMQSVLYANLSAAEFTDPIFNFDALSNGFKNRSTNATVNGSGATYIYAAFSENPFKNALAR